MKQILYSLCIIVVLTSLSGCSTKIPVMGMKDGRFAACTVDDCVSSQTDDVKYKIDPIKATGSPEIVMVDLANSVESIFGGKVLEADGNYLRAEFKSTILRTMDDAEFFYDEQAGVIHVLSMSRGDTFDFDSNRERIEKLRTFFEKKN
ncbi:MULTISPECIES: DUF1499 domain-containing protein [unclassified Pseudodesulfovibrio]|uniref:DUF1499 domain-containing protein n=1 Tax=unclassified Pseudodesulfovibrio TaxID=2661612 RepID=UPI0013E347CB|nr:MULTISPECIES: DUF1499 domain-containing protein [unclassified Pseudodesulfovibrio]MCJ2163930.1 DUF1499 domain-containing protein [Pseudodesulfovibrio sp. S3-i]